MLRSRSRQQCVEFLVALPDSDIHSAGKHPVSGCEVGQDAQHPHSRAAVGAGLESHCLEGDRIRIAFVGEGPHDPLVRANLVEAAEERRDLFAVAVVRERPCAAGSCVPRDDSRRHRPWAYPLPIQIGVDMRAEHLLRRRVELPDDLDCGYFVVRYYLGFVLGHDTSF